MQIGGVEVDVGDFDVVEVAGAERPDDLIEGCADPGDLRLGDS
jgi:hypothetical protein